MGGEYEWAYCGNMASKYVFLEYLVIYFEFKRQWNSLYLYVFLQQEI